MAGLPMRRRTGCVARSGRCRPAGGRRRTRSNASSPIASPIGARGSRRPNMAERKAFQYTILREVPDVERGERINVGVVLYSPERKFRGARVHVDRERLTVVAPQLDSDALEGHLQSLVAVADGAEDG